MPVWLLALTAGIDAFAWEVPPPGLWQLLIIAPIFEELAFRGLLQSALLRTTIGRRSLGSLSVANGLTSLAFSAVHLLRGPETALLVFCPSLVFGWVRERAGGVRWAIVVHAVYNAGYVATGALKFD